MILHRPLFPLSKTVNMGVDVFVGMAVTAHDNSRMNTSTFDHVAVTGAVATAQAMSAAATLSAADALTLDTADTAAILA